MDPAEILTVANALVRLARLGLAGWKAAGAQAVDEREAAAVARLLPSADRALASRDGRPSLELLHLELVTLAFFEAWRRHWAHYEAAAPLLAPTQWQGWLGGERRAQVDQAMRDAILRLARVGDQGADVEVALLQALTAGPLASPWYRSLWAAFVEPDERGRLPLLVLESDGRRAFERHFLLAWLDGLASKRGAPVRQYLLDLGEHRTRVVRELVVADLARQRDQHVFGTGGAAVLPPMPLDAIFVEPFGTVDDGRREPPDDDDDEADDGTVWSDEPDADSDVPRHVLGLLRDLLETHRVVVVAAPFGQGKSLTARTFAWQLAERWLTSPEPSPDLWMPVFLRCAEDLAGRPDLDAAIRRSLQRQARAVGVDARLSDAALARPPDAQRTLYLLDGLDEVALSPRDLEDLFAAMRDEASERHRFVVFSRPGSLVAAERAPGHVTVRLEPFTPAQISEWGRRWSEIGGEALTLEALEARGVADLAATPILLFLIACTWSAGAGTRAELYESFFRRIARGKHELDAERHPAIAAASMRLLAALRDRGELEASAGPIDAMLWLMGRAAWEGVRLRRQGRGLTTREIDRIVEDELGIAEGAEVTRSIRIGLLLALQADLGGDLERILFGHRSFEEFLVARWWASRLWRIVHTREREWPALERELCGGALLGREGGAADFLVAAVDGWPEPQRQALLGWAEDTLNDERVEVGPDGGIREDARGDLRLAALAVGSSMRGAPGLRLRDPGALRSLLAWSWALDHDLPLRAPRLRAPGAELQRAELVDADLSLADLTAARLYRADLKKAALDGALLRGADLFDAELERATLCEADLSGATLYRAHAFCADFTGAILVAVDATEADLARATLEGADLSDAVLEGARLVEARAQGVRLVGASLVGARLDRADLRDASLVDAVLNDASLRGADLRGADLTGAELAGADFTGARMEGATLPDST